MSKKKATKKRKTKEIDWDAYESEARQRTAWAQYYQQMYYIRAVDEEREYQSAKYNRDEKKVKEIEDKRNGRSNMLVIM